MITTQPNPIYPNLTDTFLNDCHVAVQTSTHRFTLYCDDIYAVQQIDTLDAVLCTHADIIRDFSLYEPIESLVTFDAAHARTVC